jgi:hypothetical protein
MFLDVHLVYAATDARIQRGVDAEEVVASAIGAGERMKLRRYLKAGVTGPSGPCAPGVSLLIPFVLEQGGRLSRGATRLLRQWSQARVGEQPDSQALSLDAATHLRSAHRLLSTTLQQWRAYRVHQAAEWLAAAPAGSSPCVSPVPSPGQARANAPRTSYPPRVLDLADLDPVGLALAGDV